MEIYVSVRKFKENEEAKACVFKKEGGQTYILDKDGNWKDCTGIYAIPIEERFDIDKPN